jgi:hypothetical protein
MLMDEQTKQPAQQPGWTFKPDSAAAAAPAAIPASHEEVSWTASEYVENQKSASWFIILGFGAIVMAVLIFFITGHDWVSSVVVLILAAAFGTFGARHPRTLHYSVDNKGLHIENKSYPYASFKSFSVIDEGAISSIYLMPLKRFMPSLSVYYSPDDEEKIVTVLASYLPFEDRQRDAIDRLMHKVRF